MRAVALAFFLCIAACGDNLRGQIVITSDPAFEPQLRSFVELTPYGGITMGTDPDDGYQIAVVDDPAIPLEGYRIETEGELMRVHAHDVLGAQYGVAIALESLGFRFRHPFDPLVPKVPQLVATDSNVHQPTIRVRGLHLHTLHPTEGYFAFWEPSPGSKNDAHRIIDWVVKNRGNYLQWVALDDILKPDRYEPWKAFTRELIDYAHFRGIRVGLGIQLFGQSNLQLAFDLSDDRTGTVPIAQEIAARLPIVTKDLPFDALELSFGEFFNAEPQTFVDSVNEVYRQLQGLAPGTELRGVIHVGAEQKVQFMGEELIYYFLIKFTDPAIIRDVHTVMFYNLFEPAGGAYQSENFHEHRDFLRAEMCAGRKGAYKPETAYWVAFDNSVPQFFPLYVQSRLHDLEKLQEPEGPCGTLDQHLLFSSGWDWGYWLNDVASLRASYELPANLNEAFAYELAPDLGPKAAAVVEAMSTLQHDRVMIDKLTGYIVGRDSVIDLGRNLDIISQPDRITFDQLAAGMGRAEVEGMLPVLDSYADELEALERELGTLSLPSSRWARELRDGFAINTIRARFVEATYDASLAHIDGDTARAKQRFEDAKKLIAKARPVVKSRHADLHDTHLRRTVDKTSNQTFYQFGYLYFADNLCYWQRELDQVDQQMGGTAIPASCFF
ncbi:MAG: hypothetical protein H0T46_31045 [Deltaproteobacteria bacterium]|nr:hypothetical protein [Deltaproteobacteria bacterium]